MIVKLYNSFHGTSFNLRVPALPAVLSRHQIRRARKALCSADGLCGGALCERGPQGNVVVNVVPRVGHDGYDVEVDYRRDSNGLTAQDWAVPPAVDR